MRYWIEPRWPDRRARPDRLYFHCGKLNIAKKMHVGDCVLLYETKSNNPDTQERGRGIIFGHGVVAGELQPLPAGDPDRRTVGGRDWQFVRAFRRCAQVQPDPNLTGVPLHEVRQLLGRSQKAGIRTTTEITEEQFDELWKRVCCCNRRA